ncbi:MAG: GNAT family N-acetyltransferase [Saccharospirillaceae bacterium]|nr:GNAT family N-acetyltransferase [Pseudomonadales bacterium]NRB79965.1 GNAT family N-acetyltransferase [Saccharospirillaceae bacterium]
MQKIDYRKAVVQDITDLIDLRIQQLKDEGYPETNNIRADLNEYFLNHISNNATNNSLICWVGTYNNRIIATAGLCIYQLPPSFSNPSGKIAYLTNIYTADEYRKNGIASYLIETLLNEAKTRNFLGVRLHASELGQSVYKKLGFNETNGYMDIKF